MRRRLGHGALAGLAGGAAMAVVLAVAGEGPIGRAVALEAGGDEQAFTRGVQQAGGAAGALVFGLVAGTVFAVAFAVVRPRLAARDDWRAAVTLAATAFTTVFLVPFLRYPANPPGVGDPDTIGRRTALYLLALGWSAVAGWAAWRAGRNLGGRSAPDHVRLPAVATTYVALVVIGLVALPPNPDPVAVPAALLWQFRLASVGGALALWAVLGTVFGWLQIRAAARQPERQPT
ncbi:MAG: CbtA family protein [Actinomycetota bacterium]|nr:CbtA family protein [Actinomycetota bacterium]